MYAVLHVAECAEVKTAAEGLQNYAATTAPVSWHYAADVDSVTQSVLERDTAWHAPPLNDYSIGVESAGFAKQLESEWNDDYSRRMVDEQLVPLFASICRRNGIPPRAVPDDALLSALPQLNALAGVGHVYGAPAQGEPLVVSWEQAASLFGGILSHAQISRVFKKSDHFDPGPHFPFEEFVEKVARAASSAA